ncbi:MAG: hypothetical protein IKV05_01325 [Bacteroidales bacterium]|nr:hypothetical protein [Bacteroidales bacterium]
MENDIKNQKVEIEIVRHKGLFEILRDPKQLWKVMLAMFLLIIVLFFGLAVVVVSVKSMYPYETVRTNPYGATILEDEDKEVIYWLFNTAELWANSGIEVKADDVLTIRSSGKMHTAIHHLVRDAEKNKALDDRWLGTEGAPVRKDKQARDELRTKFRIAEQKPESILLMQVIDYNHSNLSTEFITRSDSKHQDILSCKNSNEVIVIGKERRNLRPGKDGILHFAANDIVLTDKVIDSMYKQYMDSVLAYDSTQQIFNETATKEWKALYEECIKGDASIEERLDTNSTLYKALEKLHQRKDKNKYTNVGLAFKMYEQQDTLTYPVVNELTFYKKKQFRDAWFADNIGSFLIVIERKKEK